jgi:hypothetical protein
MPQESVLVSEPRWPAALALLSVGGLYYALPPELRVGPDWLVLMLVAALVIPATISHHRGNWRLSHFLGYAANSVVTLSVAISLGLLIARLPTHKDKPGQLLRSAVALWVCNMLVFACWYWRLDAGGATPAGLASVPHRWCILIPTDAIGPRTSQGNGRGSMESRFRRLPVSRLQHQHRLFAYRCACTFALG